MTEAASLVLSDPRTAEQLSGWLTDAGVSHSVTRPDHGAAWTLEAPLVLTDARTLRLQDRAIDALRTQLQLRTRPFRCLVLGDPSSWQDRDTALTLGSATFIPWPIDRESLLAHVNPAAKEAPSLGVDVLLLGPDSDANRLRAALSDLGLAARTEPDPHRLFTQLTSAKPDILVLLPQAGQIDAGKVARMIRMDSMLEDLGVIAFLAVSTPSATPARNIRWLHEPVDAKTLVAAIGECLPRGQLLELELPSDSRQRRFAKEILKGGRHLLSLIDDVLDLVRIESGRVDLSLEPIALSDVIGECLRLMQPLAERRGIGISVDVGALAVLGDRVRLRQVLVNLTSNAIKYNVDRGRVEIVATQPVAGRVRVEVRDTGRGIGPDKQRELFQPFNRLGAENGPIEGTGIGLVIVKRLVEMMGGTVGAESTPGSGSTFWLDLEAHDGSIAPDDAAFADSMLGSALPEVSHKCVLYIDDNPGNLRLVEQILARWPTIELLTAQQPRLGLELAVVHRPDLILLDIQMSPLNGFEVLERLRQHPELSDVPVIAITANAMPRDVARVMAAGFSDCITKPFDVRHFTETLTRVLNSRTDPSQAH